MTIALGKCSWLVMECQHETLQWGPLEPIKAIAIHIEQSAAQWAQAKRAKSVCCWRPPEFTSTMVMAEGDSAARQEHDSRPLELANWQRTSWISLSALGTRHKQLSTVVFWNVSGSGQGCVPGGVSPPPGPAPLPIPPRLNGIRCEGSG